MTKSLPASNRLSAFYDQAQARASAAATRSMGAYSRKMMRGYLPGLHLDQIDRKLDQVVAGKIDRLIIAMPPRFGKSQKASVHFPSYFLGHLPNKSIIAAAATTELASEWGLEVRNAIASDEYHSTFPATTLMEDAKAKGRWRTIQGGGYKSVGVGSAVLGRGGDLILIDDPYPTYEASQSATVRKQVYNWYSNTIRNRLEPGGAIVLIAHRMHPEDLAGMLIQQMKDGTGEHWEVLELPALVNGESTFPERFSTKQINAVKKVMAPQAFSALYMQDPEPEDGEFFKRKWVEYYNPHRRLPPMTLFGASDFAVTELNSSLTNPNPDFTEHGVFGLTADHSIYVLDWWYGQTEPQRWIPALLNLMQRHPTVVWGGESGVIRNAVQSTIKEQMRHRKLHRRVEWITSVKDKVARAMPIQQTMFMRKVKFPMGSAWGERVISQMCRFPGGRDDAVDVMSLAGRLLPMVPAPSFSRNAERLMRLSDLAPRGETLDQIMAAADRANRKQSSPWRQV